MKTLFYSDDLSPEKYQDSITLYFVYRLVRYFVNHHYTGKLLGEFDIHYDEVI